MPKDLPITDLNIQITEGAPVELPSADLLVDAAYQRDGEDLVLELDNGQSVTVEGYFGTTVAPALMTPDGARVTPEMVDSFLKPAHAGEYASSTTTVSDAGTIGQISEVVGTVLITRADGSEVIAEPGTLIMQGDVIETSGDGAANIVFADNTNFAISEDARLSVDEFSYDTASQEGSSFFSMLKGAFVYTSGMIGKDDPGNVSIETPAGSIGIRGTVVMGKIDPTGQDSEITIIDGAVVITNAAGTVELDDSLETVKLGDYNTEPVMMGQISPEQAQQTYESLRSVSGSTFDNGFTPQQNNDGQDPATQQQGDNAGEAELSPDGEQQPQSEGEGEQQPTADGQEPPVEQQVAPEGDQQPTDGEQPVDAQPKDATFGDGTGQQTGDASFDVPQNINDGVLNPPPGTQPPPPPPTGSDGIDASGDSTDGSDGTAGSTGAAGNTTGGDGSDGADGSAGGAIYVDNSLHVTSIMGHDGSAPHIREFEDAGFMVGRVTVGGGSGNYHFQIMDYDEVFTAGDEPFSINSNGVIQVTNPYVLDTRNFSDVDVEIRAFDTVEGEFIDFTVQVNIDQLIPTGANYVIGSETVDNLNAITIGNDLIFAGSGNDVINDGSDSGSAQGNEDFIIAGLGDDAINITGGLGRTTALGGDGADVFTYSSSATGSHTIMDGEFGDDTFDLQTTAGKQEVRGGSGNDTIKITTLDTVDILNGGDGEDRLELIQVDGTHDTIDLSGTNSINMSGIEKVEIIRAGGSTSYTLSLDNGTINNLTDNGNLLKVGQSSGGGVLATLNFTDTGSNWIEYGYSGSDTPTTNFFANNQVYQNTVSGKFVVTNVTAAFDKDGAVTLNGGGNLSDGEISDIPELASII